MMSTTAPPPIYMGAPLLIGFPRHSGAHEQRCGAPSKVAQETGRECDANVRVGQSRAPIKTTPRQWQREQ